MRADAFVVVRRRVGRERSADGERLRQNADRLQSVARKARREGDRTDPSRNSVVGLVSRTRRNATILGVLIRIIGSFQSDTKLAFGFDGIGRGEARLRS